MNNTNNKKQVTIASGFMLSDRAKDIARVEAKTKAKKGVKIEVSQDLITACLKQVQ